MAYRELFVVEIKEILRLWTQTVQSGDGDFRDMGSRLADPPTTLHHRA